MVRKRPTIDDPGGRSRVERAPIVIAQFARTGVTRDPSLAAFGMVGGRVAEQSLAVKVAGLAVASTGAA